MNMEKTYNDASTVSEFVESLNQLKSISQLKHRKTNKCTDKCLFCDLKRDKSLNVIENTPLKNEYFFILKDIYTNFEVHYLVVPYEHIEDFVTSDSLYLKKAFELGVHFMRTFKEEHSLNYTMTLNYTDWSYKVNQDLKEIRKNIRQHIHHAHLHVISGQLLNR